MLSRAATSLTLLGRHLERADHLARILGVHVALSLDRTDEPGPEFWTRFMELAGWPGSHTSHWCSGWIGGLQLLPGARGQWLALVNGYIRAEFLARLTARATGLPAALSPLEAEVSRFRRLSAPNRSYAYCFCTVE